MLTRRYFRHPGAGRDPAFACPAGEPLFWI